MQVVAGGAPTGATGMLRCPGLTQSLLAGLALGPSFECCQALVNAGRNHTMCLGAKLPALQAEAALGITRDLPGSQVRPHI